MINLKNIFLGWGKSLGILPTSEAERKLSELRLHSCKACPFSKEGKVLKFIKGGAEEVATLYCTRCHCPCEEKSLVVAEECPVGKW